MHPLVSLVVLVLTTALACATSGRDRGLGDVLVVAKVEDEDGHYYQRAAPKVLEVFSFDSRTWRPVIQEEPPGGSGGHGGGGGSPAAGGPDGEARRRRVESLRRQPGVARLVDAENGVVQYAIDSGDSAKLAKFPERILGSAVIEYGDTLCLVGGFDEADQVPRNSVYCWNPLVMELSGNANRTKATSATASGNGSKEDEEGQALLAEGWVRLPHMNTAKFRPGAVVVNGKVFVAGGYDPLQHEFLRSMEVFDDVTQRWYPAADMDEARAGLQLVQVGGSTIYAIGGWRGGQYLPTVEKYDIVRNQWTPCNPMASPRARFAAVARGQDTVFVVGGVRGFRQSDDLNTVEMYSVSKDSWSSADPPMTILKGPVRATVVAGP